MSTKTGSGAAAAVVIDILAPEGKALGERPRDIVPWEVRHRWVESRRGRLVNDHHRLIRPRLHVGRQVDRRPPLIIHLDRRLDCLHPSRLRREKTKPLRRLRRSSDHYYP